MAKTPEEMLPLLEGEEFEGLATVLEFGDEAVPALLEILANRADDSFLRHRTLVALGQVGSPTAAEAVAAFLGSPEPVDRVHAARAIANILGSDATPLLVPLLDDPDPSIRKIAVQCLGAKGGLVAIEPLRQIAESSPEEFLRAEAAEAIDRIQRREP